MKGMSKGSGNDLILLDGPLGTELLARGVETPLPGWSAHALDTAPDIVRDIHRDYAEAGARVHTANTFRTQRRWFPERWRELTHQAVTLAREALEGFDSCRLAGSISPLEDCYEPDKSPDDPRPEHRLMARALAEEGVDLLLVETFPHVGEALVAVEEAVAAGATKLIFVTGSSKRAIEDHFDTDAELERSLSASNKTDLLESIRNIVPKGVTCIYIRQGEPLGLGHAVLCARPAVGDEPFFVHLADDLIAGEPPCLRQMADDYQQHGGSIVAVEQVPHENTSNYGIVGLDDDGSQSQRITRIVEKPQPADAPSNQAVVGRYLLAPAIFDKLETTGRGAGGEIQLTDAIADLLTEEPVYAFAFKGDRFDCGSKLGYLQATVAYGLAHEDVGTLFREYLATFSDNS